MAMMQVWCARERFLSTKAAVFDSCSLSEVNWKPSDALVSEDRDALNRSDERWLRGDGDWWTEMVVGSGKAALDIVRFLEKCEGRKTMHRTHIQRCFL
jgi:hypothetical protein